jgi:hypothetical protein
MKEFGGVIKSVFSLSVPGIVWLHQSQGETRSEPVPCIKSSYQNWKIAHSL